MQATFDQLKETIIKECGSGPIYYVPNFGNFGDALLRHSTLKFFSDINLNYKEMTTIRKDWLFPFIRGGTVIYGAGGAWCRHWNHGAYYVTRFQKRFNVIVLPSSYESNYVIPNTTFFRRDNYESKKNMPSAFFCHDMAFYEGKKIGKEQSGSGIGYFFRTDAESAGKKIPRPNHDISAKGNHLSDITPFIEAINGFSVIHTDRLHVSIVACLLGKEVHLHPGSYFKNRAVFLSSMSGFFDNVYFHEQFEF